MQSKAQNVNPTIDKQPPKRPLSRSPKPLIPNAIPLPQRPRKREPPIGIEPTTYSLRMNGVLLVIRWLWKLEARCCRGFTRVQRLLVTFLRLQFHNMIHLVRSERNACKGLLRRGLLFRIRQMGQGWCQSVRQWKCTTS